MEWVPVTAALQNIGIDGCMSLFLYVFVTVRDLDPPNYLKLLDVLLSGDMSLGLTEDRVIPQGNRHSAFKMAIRGVQCIYMYIPYLQTHPSKFL